MCFFKIHSFHLPQNVPWTNEMTRVISASTGINRVRLDHHISCKHDDREIPLKSSTKWRHGDKWLTGHLKSITNVHASWIITCFQNINQFLKTFKNVFTNSPSINICDIIWDMIQHYKIDNTIPPGRRFCFSMPCVLSSLLSPMACEWKYFKKLLQYVTTIIILRLEISCLNVLLALSIITVII